MNSSLRPISCMCLRMSSSFDVNKCIIVNEITEYLNVIYLWIGIFLIEYILFIVLLMVMLVKHGILKMCQILNK